MGRLPTLVGVILIVAGAAVAETPRPTQLPLTSVALVADLDAPPDPDDPGTGGGFDLQVYFQTRLADARAIQACMGPVERAADQWATELGLSKGLKEQTEAGLTLHYVKAGMPGFFSVAYRVEQHVTARARVDYVALDGTQRSPEVAKELIDAFHIAAFEDALDAALKCNGKVT